MKQQIIDFYLDYTNNYLTASKMAEDYGLTIYECKQLIDIGRKYHHQK